MTFPTEWKNEIHVPNHQPEIDELGVSSGYVPRINYESGYFFL
jgi:hypothetical protein